MARDLTKGNTDRVLFAFSLPMFISVIFQQLYSMADSAIAGRFSANGKNAIAAVGASYPITMIFMAVAIGASVGVSVVVSQFFGREDYARMKTAIYTSLITIAVTAVVLTAAGIFTTEYMMKALRTDPEIFGDSSLYLSIYIWGLLFLFIYNACTGVFNALGDSKTPLWLLIGSSVGNIILDYIFVRFLHLDVAGVAWATFIAQGASCIVAFILLLIRVRQIGDNKNIKIFSLKLLGSVSYIAVPSILQQSFVSVGNLFIQSLINAHGTDVIAGYSAAIKLNTFAITSFSTFSNAVSNFTAQNYGANEFKRIRSGFKSGIKLVLLFAVPCTLIFFFFGSQCMGLFMKSDEAAAIETGATFLKIVSPFYLLVAVKLICDGILRGTSKITFFMATTFSDLILRVILAFVLDKPFGETGIWLSWPVGWAVATALALCLYGVVVKRDLKSQPPLAAAAGG